MQDWNTRGISLGALLLATGCVATVRPGRVAVVAPVGVVYVHREPPPMRMEVVPAPPTVEHVWVPGHWAWRGDDYAWVPGHHAVRPHPRAVWVEGHWSRHPSGWYWTEGCWR